MMTSQQVKIIVGHLVPYVQKVLKLSLHHHGFELVVTGSFIQTYVCILSFYTTAQAVPWQGSPVPPGRGGPDHS